MTKSEWLTNTDPQAMLSFLRGSGRASDRKARLFTVAACRRIWRLLTDDRSRRGVELVEQYADGLASDWELAAATVKVNVAATETSATACDDSADSLAAKAVAAACGNDAEMVAAYTAAATEALLGRVARRTELTAQSDLLRDIIGNPFRSPYLDPALRATQVVTVALAAYDDRVLPAGTPDPSRLAELAAALEAAGCKDAELLGHLRGPGPHVRGCWAVDLILGRS